MKQEDKITMEVLLDKATADFYNAMDQDTRDAFVEKALEAYLAKWEAKLPAADDDVMIEVILKLRRDGGHDYTIRNFVKGMPKAVEGTLVLGMLATVSKRGVTTETK